MLKLMLLTAGVLLLSGEAHAQDAAAGQKTFNQCRSCHQVGATAKNGVGPTLNGLFGRPAGSIAGYAYSDANKNSHLVWTEETFAEYIKNPRAKMPGTKMAFAGLKDDTVIAGLTTYLKAFAADGTTAP
jgi:cytochrome c